MIKNKNLIKTAVGMALVGGLSFFVNGYYLQKKHESIYGTFENPRYSAKSQINTETKTYNKLSSLEKRTIENYIPKIDSLKNKIDDYQCQLDSLKIYFMNNDFEKCQEDKIEKFTRLYYEINSMYPDFTKTNINLSNDLPNFKFDEIYNLNYEAKEHSKKIAEKITNKNFPEDLSIEIGKIDEKWIIGRYIFDGKKITVKDSLCYAQTLMTFIHEIGHAFSQQNEKYYNYFNYLTKNYKKESGLMDEASAYALEFSSPYFVEDTILSKKMFNLMYLNIKRSLISYLEGNPDIHHEAKIIADATITYFNDPAKAYNYLSLTKYKEIDPKIWEIIDLNIIKLDNRKNLLKLKEFHKEIKNEYSCLLENANQINSEYNLLKN